VSVDHIGLRLRERLVVARGVLRDVDLALGDANDDLAVIEVRVAGQEVAEDPHDHGRSPDLGNVSGNALVRARALHQRCNDDLKRRCETVRGE
jgi:hypothetical protein